MSSTDGQEPAETLDEAYCRDRNVADESTGPGETRLGILTRGVLAVGPVVLLLVLIDVAARRALPAETLLPYMQKEVAFYTVKLERFLERPAPDVLFLGSSRVRDAMVPAVFDRALEQHWRRPAEVFNLGLGGAHLAEVHAISASHLPDPPPPFVIYGISGGEMREIHDFQYASRFLWDFSGFLDYLGRVSFADFKVKNVEYFIESLLGRMWYVFRFRDALARRTTDRLESLFGKGGGTTVAADTEEEQRQRTIQHVLAEDGYYPYFPRTRVSRQVLEKRGDLRAVTPEQLARIQTMIDDASVDLLRETIESLRAAGSRVALVECPPSPNLQDYIPELHGAKFRRWMIDTADELGVLFIPFPPEETSLSDAFYRDDNHLTEQGANYYTNLVFQKLRDAGFLDGPD